MTAKKKLLIRQLFFILFLLRNRQGRGAVQTDVG